MISEHLKEENTLSWGVIDSFVRSVGTQHGTKATKHRASCSSRVWNSVPVAPCHGHSPRTITTLAKEKRHWCISGGYPEFTQTRNSFSLACSSTHQNCCRKMPWDKRLHTQLLPDKAQMLAPMNTCLAPSPAALLPNSPHLIKDLNPILYLSTQPLC